ncbi:MAG: S8/S53 family peptidase [Oscillospiraceae bacterium]|nr:S8/S53 family peptidase [Oscillospiraceae bacterium]
MFVQKGKRSISFLCCLALLLSLVSGIPPAMAEPTVPKITAELQAELDGLGDGDTVKIHIWIEGIDRDEIQEEVKDELGFDGLMLEREGIAVMDELFTEGPDVPEDLYWNHVLNTGEHRVLTKKVSDYISVERKIARQKYGELHQDFEATHLEDALIDFQCNYTPMIICRVSKAEVYTLEDVPEVVSLELYVETEDEDEGDLEISLPSIDAIYPRDELGLDGGARDGAPAVVVGIFESHWVRTDIESLSHHAKIDRPGKDGPINYGDHPSLVAKIIAGKDGLVPNARLVSAKAESSDFYKGINTLIENGVNVINVSWGLGNSGNYTARAKWVDSIINENGVSFVKSAGNVGNGRISDPGMAYNGITVGSITDKGTLRLNDDEYSSYSSYVNLSGFASKPDVLAPGEGFILPEGNDSAYRRGVNGTSFSAPHVTGVIAQMMTINPLVRMRPDTVKAALMATCNRKVPTTPAEAMSSITNRQGAGVVNARRACYAVATGVLSSVEAGVFYSDTTEAISNQEEITAVLIPDLPAVITLSWLMKHTSGGFFPVDNPALALTDLDLEVYDSEGVLVGHSHSRTNNAEYVRFTPKSDLPYTIKVIPHSGDDTIEKFSVAWSSHEIPEWGIDYENINRIRVPGISDISDDDSRKFWIDLQDEALILPEGFVPTSFSVKSGKWKTIKNTDITNSKHPLSTTKFPKLLNKELSLVISNGMETVTFDQVKKRPKLDKFKINYEAAADKTGVTTGCWVLTNTINPLIDETKAKLQVGAAKGKTVDPDTGFGRFYPGLTSGIPIRPLEDGTKTVYFIRTAPTDTGGYTPASKPKKISAKNEQKPTKYKKDKPIKLKEGDYIYAGNLANLGADAIPALSSLSPRTLMVARGKITVSITGISEPIYIWKGATAKKPVSQKQILE